jgi:hypothetical protein
MVIIVLLYLSPIITTLYCLSSIGTAGYLLKLVLVSESYHVTSRKDTVVMKY